jgi:hypothetical protein
VPNDNLRNKEDNYIAEKKYFLPRYLDMFKAQSTAVSVGIDPFQVSHETVFGGNICYESVFAFLLAATHSRSISESIPSIRQPSAYSSF